MSFCSNCGQKLPTQIKFCPNCGTKISNIISKEHQIGYKEKMYKNTVISLKKEGENFIKNKANEAFTTFAKNKFTATESKRPISEVFKPKRVNTVASKESLPEKTKKFNKWTWIYIIINGLLLYLGNQSEEVLGVLFFSFFILLMVFLRREKEKPYNWWVKIILVVQLIFLIALVADKFEYVSAITLLFIGLLVSNFILLFKGNKS